VRILTDNIGWRAGVLAFCSPYAQSWSVGLIFSSWAHTHMPEICTIRFLLLSSNCAYV